MIHKVLDMKILERVFEFTHDIDECSFFQYSAVFFSASVIGGASNEPISSGFDRRIAGCRTLICRFGQYLSVAYLHKKEYMINENSRYNTCILYFFFG